MKIFLGPAGNCITSNEPGTVGSLKRLADLKLNCQEIEFVRGVYMKNSAAKEIGRVAKDPQAI